MEKKPNEQTDVKRNQHRKMIGPVIWAVFFVVVFSMGIWLFLWAFSAGDFPWLICAIYLVVFAGALIGIIAAFIQRVREIRRGEEDEALQY